MRKENRYAEVLSLILELHLHCPSLVHGTCRTLSIAFGAVSPQSATRRSLCSHGPRANILGVPGSEVEEGIPQKT